MTMRERQKAIISDYVNGLRGEMSSESAGELLDEILRELMDPSEGMQQVGSGVMGERQMPTYDAARDVFVTMVRQILDEPQQEDTAP